MEEMDVEAIVKRHAEALQQNISLAETLGATVVRVKADKPADGLIWLNWLGASDSSVLVPGSWRPERHSATRFCQVCIPA
jgi:hypothetical protein